MKKIKITLSILLIVLITSHAYSQYDDVILFLGDVTLSTQAEVDAFNYTYVTGALTISGNDITNLDALSALIEVGALIITQNGSLTNVNGLSALTAVGYIIINQNGSLTNVNGLSALSNVGGSINILNNPVLTNLDGFSSITSMNGSITISDNASLETINGFSGLSSIYSGDPIGPGLTISDNASLEMINGFSSLSWVFGGLRISNNQQLKSFIGFKQLEIIEGVAYLVNNASLTNIEGLSSLRAVSGKFAGISVTNNAALLNIDGLSSLSSTGNYGFIEILNNPVLKNINGLASLTVFPNGAGPSWITIQNNAELENIDGLANLRGPYGIYLPSYITITNNQGLARCNGLYPLLVSIGWDVVNTHIEDGSFVVTENGAGCTMEDIINSGPHVIEAFSVINKHTGDQVSQPFNTGVVTLDLANPDFSNWAIKAHTFPSPVGSVQFRLADKSKQKDSTAPYVFVPHSLHKPGIYTLSGVPYSDSNGKGEQGIEGTLTITVINSGANNLIASNQDQSEELSIYPVPVEDELHLKMNDNAGSDALLAIRSIQGNLVYTGQVSQVSSINTLNFQPGVYVLQVFGNNGFHKVVRFIKK